MGKALMVVSNIAGPGNGTFCVLSGAMQGPTIEARAQFLATHAATLSNLAFRISNGGSGTNTVDFRKNAANGNMGASRAGTGVASDSTHTDAISVNDLVNLSLTDTGTTPGYLWVKTNIELAIGHGSIHTGNNAQSGQAFSTASATRLAALYGAITSSSLTDENRVAIRNRAYNRFASLQAFIISNARTTDSAIANRIAGAAGTGLLTIPAGLSGLFIDSVIGDGIGDGDTLAAAVTLGSGTGNLTVASISAVLTSSTFKSETVHGTAGLASRAASATATYFPLGGRFDSLSGTSDATARLPVGFNGTASNLRCYLTANTYTTDATLKLFKNGVAVLTTTITANGGAGWYENTTDSATFVATDELSFEIVGGSSGSISIASLAITLSDDDAIAANALPHGAATPRRRRAYERLAERRTKEIRELAAQAEQVKAQIAEVKDQPRARPKWIALEDVGQALQAPTLPALTLRLSGIVERVQQLEARLAMILAAMQAEDEEEEAVLLLL